MSKPDNELDDILYGLTEACGVINKDIAEAKVALERLIGQRVVAAIKEDKEYRVFPSKSLCGCAMCSFHREAYDLSITTHSKKDNT